MFTGNTTSGDNTNALLREDDTLLALFQDVSSLSVTLSNALLLVKS
jgi:hypothetical protein